MHWGLLACALLNCHLPFSGVSCLWATPRCCLCVAVCPEHSCFAVTAPPYAFPVGPSHLPLGVCHACQNSVSALPVSLPRVSMQQALGSPQKRRVFLLVSA